MFRCLRPFTLVLAIAAAAALPAPALAQAGHGGTPAVTDATAGHDHAAHEKGELLPPLKQGLPAMIAAFVVFGIVFLILSRKAWPLINQGLAARAEKIRAEIEAAEQAQRKAREALAQYEKNLADAHAESQRMLAETKAQQAALAADLRAKADAELTAMREKARRDIDSAKRAALKEIHDEAATLAASIAAKILQREVKPADHQRLVYESLAELEHVGRA